MVVYEIGDAIIHAHTCKRLSAHPVFLRETISLGMKSILDPPRIQSAVSQFRSAHATAKHLSLMVHYNDDASKILNMKLRTSCLFQYGCVLEFLDDLTFHETSVP